MFIVYITEYNKSVDGTSNGSSIIQRVGSRWKAHMKPAAKKTLMLQEEIDET
jgi:hypothetical protein